MNKIIYKVVFNRKRRLRTDGRGLVQIEAYQQRQRKYFTTRIYILPEQWDKRGHRVKEHPNADAINQLIARQLHGLESMELALWNRGKSVTLELLKQVAARHTDGDSFLEFWAQAMNHGHTRGSTRKNHGSTLRLLRLFRHSVRFEEVTYELVCHFEHFLLAEGYHPNTVAKHLKHLKRYVNLAINQERIDVRQYPFRKFRIHTIDYGHTCLTPDELTQMESLAGLCIEPLQRRCLDAFLFCCYAGLRYSDFCSLQPDNLVAMDEGLWLVYRSVKTDVEVRLPLYLLFEGKAVAILARHAGAPGDFFRLPSNSTVNKHLAALALRAGIGKRVSFHTARHTNASLLLYRGVNITTVQKLLGHKSVRTTQGYANVMDCTLIGDLEHCFGHGLPHSRP